MDKVTPCKQRLKEPDALDSLSLLKENAEEAHGVLLFQMELELPEANLGLKSQQTRNAF